MRQPPMQGFRRVDGEGYRRFSAALMCFHAMSEKSRGSVILSASLMMFSFTSKSCSPQYGENNTCASHREVSGWRTSEFGTITCTVPFLGHDIGTVEGNSIRTELDFCSHPSPFERVFQDRRQTGIGCVPSSSLKHLFGGDMTTERIPERG